MSTYIFDTETVDRDGTEIIEAAWLRIRAVDGLLGIDEEAIPPTDTLPIIEYFTQRFLPTKPVTFGSIGVHHILPSELLDCPPSSSFQLREDATYIIGHSIDYDWAAIGSPERVKRICTDAMARWIWPDATGYSQIALTYMLLGATPATRELVRSAHSASADCLLNLRLLQHILALKPAITTWSQLWDYSEKCREPRTCRFKQYQDMLLEEVPIDFVMWVLRQHWITPYERRAYQRAYDAACRPVNRFGDEAIATTDVDDGEPW